MLLLAVLPHWASAQRVFYSYQSGPWTPTEWRTWTLDPSGTTLINPSALPPGAADHVVILNGRVVTIPTGTPARTVASVTIQQGGVLDITNTTGHNFGAQLNGAGTLRISTATFPAFAAGTFVEAGGGTVEYTGMGGFTFTQFEYNNLIINLNNSSDEALFVNTANAFTVNGELTMERGLLRINNNTNTTALTLNFHGDVVVNPNGRIGVGSISIGDAAHATNRSHRITIGGDLINNGGEVRFTTLTAASYTANPAGGWSDVIFSNATEDQHVVCNGPTVFYRLVIDKGIDQTHLLHVDAQDVAFFQLMGRNDQQDHNPGTPPNVHNRNALGLLAGTLRLGPNISVPSLATNSYMVDQDAGLWIDGASVTLQSPASAGAIRVNGLLRFSAGSRVDINGPSGIILRETGTVLVEDGDVTTTTFRASTLAGTPHRGAFRMLGGTFRVTSYDPNTFANQMASFALPYDQSVFEMAGGILTIEESKGVAGNGNSFSLMLGSLPENASVTGGTVRINTTPRNAFINSTVPLHHLEVFGTANTFEVRPVTVANAPALATAQPLVVRGNLTLQDAAHFNNTQSVNVLLGGDLVVTAAAQYSPGSNTTVFNGGGIQTLNVLGGIHPHLNHLSVTQGSTLQLDNADVVVNGNFLLDSNCRLVDNGRSLEVRGNLTLSGEHVKPPSAPGRIILRGTGHQVIAGNGQGRVNNLSLDKLGGSVTLAADMTITGHLRLANAAARLMVGSHRLTLGPHADVFDDLTGSGRAFDSSRMIQTGGLASDQGVCRVYGAAPTFLFPFGASGHYLPAQVEFTAHPSGWGTVCSRPVASRHPLLQGAANGLLCYWKTEGQGFTGVMPGSVTHRYFYTDGLAEGAQGEYIPAAHRAGAWHSVSNPDHVNEGTKEVLLSALGWIDGDFTAGSPAAFGASPVLYSAQSGEWDDPATWSAVGVGGAGGAGIPGPGTVVVIGDMAHSHEVALDANGARSGRLAIAEGSMLDVAGFVDLQLGEFFEHGTAGKGTLRIGRGGFPGGDFGALLGPGGGTVEYYTAGSDYTLPALSESGAALGQYFNLTLMPESGRTLTLPAANLRALNHLIVLDEGQVHTNGSNTLEVMGNLVVALGVLEVRNASATTIRVRGEMNVEGTFRAQNSPGVNHQLELFGSLTGEGNFLAANGAGRILTFFRGSANAAIQGATKAFHSLEVDKGVSPAPVLSVEALITTAFDPALTLTNGTLRLRSGMLNVTTAAGFTIPATAALSADGGTLNIITADNSNHLVLRGRLELLSGTINVGNTSATGRNDIEYSPVGNPEIVVSGGVLNVKGQIRRNVNYTQGALRFTQTGGTVNIQGTNQVATRAKLEVCNPGSSLTLSGGVINIFRGGGTTFSDLYLRPEAWAVTGGTVHLQVGGTGASQSYGLDVASNLHHLTITGEGAHTATVNLRVNPLVLTGNLAIDNALSVLQTHGLDVAIAGNFTNNGQYLAGGNTTIFNGAAPQTVTLGAATTFSQLLVDKPAAVQLVLASGSQSPTIADTLTIGSGTLVNQDAVNILLQGHVVNNGRHTSTGTGSLIFGGTANQLVLGEGLGRFGNINLNNGASNGITLKANTQVDGVLTLTTGYLYTDDYLLTLSSTASIGGTPGIPASSNWIITNGVLSDAGVRRVFPAASPATFTFPIGVAGKYTPATFTLTYTSPGSITVKPINSRIPSVTSAVAQELAYYWNVTSTPFGGLGTVTHTYTYVQGDVRGNENAYVGARFHNYLWTNLGPGAVNATANALSFSAPYIDGEFTGGEPTSFDPKPIYFSRMGAPNITTTGADWDLPGTWATGSHSGPAATAPPSGNPMVIHADHRVVVHQNDRIAYSVNLLGVLDLQTTNGHNLGHVSGSGRLIISNSAHRQFVFPGGLYTQFMETPGSTVEYFGQGVGGASISPIIRTYQNLEFTGPADKTMSSVDILVKGNLLIRSSALLNTTFHRNITIRGHWDNNVPNGFAPGRGTVTFQGSAPQTISTPNPEHFHNLRINNPAGVTLLGHAQVSNRLFLTNGLLHTATDRLLTLTSLMINAAVGGSDASFVNGPLAKRILIGQSFLFPVGHHNPSAAKPSRFGSMRLSNVSATGFWTARYFNQSPHPTFSRDSLEWPITGVSNNEYWVVDRPAGSTANVRLRWDAHSGIATLGTTTVVQWTTPQGRWFSRGGAVSGTLAAGWVSNTMPITSDEYVFTLAVLGVTASITDSTSIAICNNGEMAQIPVRLTGTPGWTLTYSDGVNTFTETGIMSELYTIRLTGTDLGGPGSYTIRLLSVTDGTGAPGILDLRTVSLQVKATSIPSIVGNTGTAINETRSYFTVETPGNSYLWELIPASGGTIHSPDAAATTITYGSTTGIHTLRLTEITATTGCAFTVERSINVSTNPVPRITPADPNVCLNQEVEYSTERIAGNEYLWTVTNGDCPDCGVYSDSHSVRVTWHTPGSGAIRVRERLVGSGEPGTFGESTLNVVVNPSIPTATLTASATQILRTQSVTFTAGGGVLYTFYVDGVAVQGPSADNTFRASSWPEIRDYSVHAVVTAPNGCSSPSQVITVSVHSRPFPPVITPVTPGLSLTDACLGVAVEYSTPAVEGCEYKWLVTNGDCVGCGVFGPSPRVTVVWSQLGQGELIAVVRIIGETDEGNHSRDTIAPTIHPNPALALVSTTPVSCPGGSDGEAQVSASGGNAPYTFLWQGIPLGATLSNAAGGSHTVVVTDRFGCADSLTVEITQPDSLWAVAIVEHPFCSEQANGLIVLDSIRGGTGPHSVSWADGGTGPRAEGLLPGTHTVTLTDAHGCQRQFAYTLLAAHPYCLKVPTIFTPNGDGLNDSWEIPGLHLHPQARVEVFDRNGRRVFHSAGYPTPWDGTFRGRALPIDSYHFVITPGDGSGPIRGHVTLVR